MFLLEVNFKIVSTYSHFKSLADYSSYDGQIIADVYILTTGESGHLIKSGHNSLYIFGEYFDLFARRCSKCRYYKEAIDFPQCHHGLLGIESECRSCVNARKRTYSTVALSPMKRRIERVNAGDTDTQYLTRFLAQKSICPITGYSPAHVEHIMPVSKGDWGNTSKNLMYLHPKLNISKNDKNVFDWLDSITEDKLFYLTGEKWSVGVFKQKYLEVLSIIAKEQGLNLQEYKEAYYKDYG